MAYRHSMESQLTHLFEECESQRKLLASSNKHESIALELRAKHGDAIRSPIGFYARKPYWDNLHPREKTKHMIKTYAELHPELIFSHTSAAVMYGLEVHWGYLLPLHATICNTKRGHKNANIIRHRIAAPVGILKDNVAVTSLEQTLVDCAISFPLGISLAIADSALHLGLTTKTKLSNYSENKNCKRGICKAKKVIKLADPRPDNGGESYVRAVMIECGLPMPELQAPVENPDKPGHMYYVDFMFTRPDGAKVAMELDGMEKYENPQMTHGANMSEVMRKERRREALITSHGLQIVRFSYKEAIDPKILLPRLALYGITPKPKRGRPNKHRIG